MAYVKIGWTNSPSTSTPINATNLNKMDTQIKTNETNITTNASDISALDTRVTSAEETIDNDRTYSTTEQVIGKWFNGKPLYRKVISIGNLPNTTTKTVETGLTINSTHCIVTKIYGVANYSNGITLPLPFTSEAAGASIVINTNNSNQLSITTGTDRSAATGYIILEYYKATDSAN